MHCMGMEMNYKQALEYLKQVNIYGSVLGLDTIKELLRRLGNPQNNLKVVHIAGTNGKGSTGAFLQSILMKAGYKVGRYSSPAVFETREIIKVHNENISETDYASCIARIKDKCQEMIGDGLPHPTPFEIETAMAFMYLKEQQCDICLVECGMGGETDATNVFESVLCSVITCISIDHTQFLGETLSDIAKVKAGIIKKECPVVVAPQSMEAHKVIEQIAGQLSSPLTVADSKITAELKMKGSFQHINAAVAMEAALVLEKAGFEVADFIEEGIMNAYWPGRLETISEKPLIVIDGAHNPAAVRELATSIDLYFTNRKIAFIMGVLSDKDFKMEAEIIADKAVKIITVTPNNKRGLDAQLLKDTLMEFNPNVVSAISLEDGLNQALTVINQNQADMILAFGSLSYLGELKKLVQKA